MVFATEDGGDNGGSDGDLLGFVVTTVRFAQEPSGLHSDTKVSCKYMNLSYELCV